MPAASVEQKKIHFSATTSTPELALGWLISFRQTKIKQNTVLFGPDLKYMRAWQNIPRFGSY
jgi:hypothetical protein